MATAKTIPASADQPYTEGVVDAETQYISKVTLPNNQTAYIKDALARQTIANIKEAIDGGTHFLGVTTTALTDGAATNPVEINGSQVTANTGDFVIVANSGSEPYIEFIWTGSAWTELGSTGSLKALAYKDSASAEYTPAGTVTVNYTPEGTVTVPAITPAGTVTVDYTPEGTVTVPAITPAGTVTVDYTPEGTVTVPAITPAGTVTVDYTPEGTVTVPAITPAGTVSKPDVTVTPVTAAEFGYVASASYANETLTLSMATVSSMVTGVSAELAAAPTFTGTTIAATSVALAGTAAATDIATFAGTTIEATSVALAGTAAATDIATFAGTTIEATSVALAGTAAATNIATFAGTTATITVS